MRTPERLLLSCIMLLFACNHSRKNEVTVTSRSFGEEIQPQENLVFAFSKDLYPDSLLNHWDSTQYIRFTPAVAGRFKWNFSSELLFSPATRFEPGTEYTATLTDKLLTHAQANYHLPEKYTFRFHTPYLQVTNNNISWVRGNNAGVMVQADLTFNYEVNASEAARAISIASGQRKVDFITGSNGNGRTVTLQFSPLNSLDQETPLTITVKKGIKVTSHYTSATDTVIHTIIPSRYNLTVNDVVAEHTGTEGIITVYTSQPLQESNLKDLISIEPAVNFDIRTNDQGLVISSPGFNAKNTYQLSISAKVEGIFGGKLKTLVSQPVSFGKLKPSITFVNSKGMYLPAKGYRNIALNIVNVPKVKVSVVKVYENNLEQFFRDGQRYGYGYEDSNDGEYNGGSYTYYDTGEIGDTVFQKEYAANTLPKLNSARVLHLDFEDKIKDFKGIYVLTVASSDHYWITQSKVISVSDIGLIVRQEKDAVYVFANSFKTASPLSGVNIAFISSNNQQLYSTATNSDGVAVFEHIGDRSPGFRVGMVTAQQDQDFNFVLFSQAGIETSRFDVGGKTGNSAGLDAMIYGDRNLYRPGETIHISTIVRDEHWQSPGEVPVKIKLRAPDGKEYTTIKKILNEQGSCETAITMPPAVMTGTYSLEVYTGNDVLLNTSDISIEEFMPDRIKASMQTDKTAYQPGDSILATAKAENLFGTPAAGRNYQYELNLQRDVFRPKQFPAYNFNTVKDFNFPTQLLEDKTDEQGNSREIFKIPGNTKDMGVLRGNIMFTVFDETGRPVHRYQNFPVYTQTVFPGIKQMDEYVSTRSPIAVPLIAVDKNGNVLNNIAAEVTIVKKEWQTVIEKSGNGFRYVSQEQVKPLQRQSLYISGANTLFYYTPQLSGAYEVRVSLPGSDAYVAQPFYAWGWGDTQFSSFEVNNEGNVDITTDKDQYTTGDPVKVLFTTPFDGKLLVTTERNHLIKYYYLSTEKKSASLTLKATDDFVPNVYITATLIRPMDNSSMPLTVAHGYKSLKVGDPSAVLPVSITAVAHSRSKTAQLITVKTRPGAYVTIAAVDEGILQVKGYQSPDPYHYFYQQQALQVNGYDVYPFLLPEIESRSSTGGDAEKKSLEMRVNPDFVNRVRLVSFWSGIKAADRNGEVKFSVALPSFSGDIRMMAVAYKGNAFGSSEQHMKVADPIVISTALPRFMSPKDTVIVPVTLSNTTNTNANGTISITCNGPLNVSGEATQAISLKAGGEKRVVFKVYAGQQTGAGKVTVRATALQETFTDETDMSVRPPASLQKRTGSGIVQAGHTIEIKADGNFIPKTAGGKLVISRSPLLQFAKNLDYLVQYPYGCVEQTVSAAFPQLYYADLVKSLYGTTDKDMRPDDNVQQAITKLQSMQMSNGALSFWPGGGYESWWGSIYAAHFLWEAKKAGSTVNQQTIDRLFDYMKFKLRTRSTFVYYYNRTLSKEIAPEEVAYSLFLLALAGQPQISVMNYYKANPELLSLDSRYLIAAAFYLAGQKENYRQMLPPAFEGEEANTASGGSFYSYIRDQAIALYALLQAEPDNQQTGIMAKHLSEALKNKRYLNTQENAFAFLALGEISRQTNASNVAATLRAEGKVIGSVNNKDLSIDLKDHLQDPLSLQVTGSGAYYYFWENSGIPADGSYVQEDSYLQVRRTYYDRNGRPVLDNTFHQNDLIVVKISIVSQQGTNVDNVVITDMLPAGLEIENPRISEVPQVKWIKDAAEPDYIDYRDDRINLFTAVDSHTKSFYYVLRAVSPGTYQLGPVQADAMYNGEYHSYNGAGTVTVLE